MNYPLVRISGKRMPDGFLYHKKLRYKVK